MPKYLSGRVKRTPQGFLSTDRYQYLGLDQAEPNLGDPANPLPNVPTGQQFQIVSLREKPGERFWIPLTGGIQPGSITVRDEGTIIPNGSGISSITDVNFVGSAVNVIGFLDDNSDPGVAVTVTISPPGNDNEILFNDNGDFGTSSIFTFDNSTTGIASVGIGTSQPTQNLHIVGNLRLENTFFDEENQSGNQGDLLVKTASGGLKYTPQSSVTSGAGGTITEIQFHDSTGLVNGADNFVFDFTNERVGIGSTQPDRLLDVLGNSRFTGVTTFTTGTNKHISLVNAAHEDLSGEGSAIVFSRQNDGSLQLSGIFSHTNGALGIAAREGLTFHVAGGSTYSATEEALRIDTDGKVGIGTVSPAHKLDVIGDIRSNLSTPSLYLQTTGISTGSALIRFGDADSFQRGGIQYDFSGDNHLRFKMGGAGNNVERMTIVGSTGAVGIGSTIPTAKLDVNGNTELDDLNVSGVSTFAGITTVTGGGLFAKQLSVSGVITATEFVGQINTTLERLEVNTLKVNGISTFVGLSTFNDGIIVESGISTFNDNVIVGSGKSVGIGTDSIGATLTVQSDSSNTNMAGHNYLASQSGIILQNRTASSGHFTAYTGNVVSSGGYTQSGSLAFESTGSGTAPKIHITQRTGSGVQTKRLTIDTNGKVGINSTIPAVNGIDLIGPSSGNGEIQASRDGGASILTQAQDSLGRFGTSSNHNLQLMANSNGVVNITTGGKVGIGTDDPDSKLHVVGQGNESITLKAEPGISTGNFSQLVLGRTSEAPTVHTTPVVKGGIPISGVPGILFGSENTNLPAIGFQTPNTDNGHIVFKPKGSEKVRITSDGKVGINTLTPTADFEVTGNPGTATTIFINSSDPASTVVAEAVLKFGFGHSGNPDAVSEIKLVEGSTNSFGGDLTFSVPSNNGLEGDLGGSTTSEALRIDSSGRLLVGLTSDPAESTIVAKGNSTDTTSYSVLDMRRGEPAEDVDDVLGYIRFSDTNIPSSNNNYALIHAAVDAASSGQGDNPGRLVFSTTADGASGPTERLRISSSGYMQLKNSAGSTFALLRNAASTNNTDLLGSIDFGSVDWDSSTTQVASYQDGTDKGSGSLRFATSITSASGLQERLRITSGGSVNIGGDYSQTTHKMKVTGTVAATNFDSLSDQKLKLNIKKIEKPIETVNKIDGVTFNWKEDNSPSMGVIAQNIEKVLPQIVSGDDIKSVNYSGLIGLLIEVVKDQQKQIDELRDRLDK